MRVLNSSSVQWAWESCAVAVEQEAAHWEASERLSSLVQAVWARVLATGSFIWYAGSESVGFVFKVFAIAGNFANSESSLLSLQMLQRVARVTFVTIRVLFAEVFIFAVGSVIPELAFGKWQLHKQIVRTQLDAFVTSLPDFPVKQGIDLFHQSKELTKLLVDLGVKNEAWKARLYNRALEEFEEGKVSATLLLNESSKEFRYLLFEVLYQELAESLNRHLAKEKINREPLKQMTPFIFFSVFNKLSLASQQSLLGSCNSWQTLLHETHPGVENNFFVSSGFPFRHPHTTQLSSVYLDKMKGARDELLQKKIFTEEDVLGATDAPWAAITCIGMWRFLESAEVEGENVLVFPSRTGFELRLENESQFFGIKCKLQELKRALAKLTTSEQKEALFERLCYDDQAVKAALGALSKSYEDPEVQACFKLFGDLSHNVINPQITKCSTYLNRRMIDFRKEDTVQWYEACSC